MTDEDMKTMGAQVPSDTAQVVKQKLEYGEWSEYARRLAEVIAHGDADDERTPFDVAIEKKRQDLADARDERDKWQGRVDDYEREIERLKREREEYKTTQDRFEGAVWQLEQNFRAGEIGHLYASHTKIKNLGEQFDRDPDTLMDLLRERNPDVPDHAFKQLAYATDKFTGLPSDVVGTPVEEREA